MSAQSENNKINKWNDSHNSYISPMPNPKVANNEKPAQHIRQYCNTDDYQQLEKILKYWKPLHNAIDMASHNTKDNTWKKILNNNKIINTKTQQEAHLMLTNMHDALEGQSRSTNSTIPRYVDFYMVQY